MANLLLRAVYPKKCICCGRVIPEDIDVCTLCEENIERVSDRKRCRKCGLEKKRCRCRTNVYHFQSVIAPFYNKGLIKRGFYRYKLGGLEQYADFFAANMTECIEKEYGDIAFDAVCFVPPSKERMRRYGFNPSEQLARIIADKMGIELIEDALLCRERKSVQHTANKTERFESVRGRYTSAKKIHSKVILLVDDIMSTGATLDECAKQLLLGGADEVHCIAALLTDNKSGDLTQYARAVVGQVGK